MRGKALGTFSRKKLQINHRWMDFVLTGQFRHCFHPLNGFYGHFCLKFRTVLFPFLAHEQLLRFRVVQSLTPCPVFGVHYSMVAAIALMTWYLIVTLPSGAY